MKYLLTIVTVCFNSEKTIEKCVTSVKNQLTKNIEYLIVDGKSSDNTINIIRKFQSDQIRLISETDEGIYDAMNKGIRNSQGTWIWFVNSDDYIKNGQVENLISYLKKLENYDCIYGDLEYVRVINNEFFMNTKKTTLDLKHLKNEMVMAHPSTVCKKDALLEVGVFDTNFKIAADWDLLLRLYNLHYNFVHIDTILSRFYCNGASSKPHILERHKVRKKNKSYKLIDVYMLKDVVKLVIFSILKPIKNKMLKK
ncbi:glycosyl transferase, family 2 [Sporolactobacillus inulinus]|uniref:Glycosyl transferase, family 2 n=1 Tax=Sporolactobacillus inulinus TaxID=2078 RepID=A0A4Y1ZAZ3_9BACL|nr:glycosyltransferase family 2 protein [Sporolactobacillus inulinus]GAY76209.1 glycosyl transferase, family 2 [Sporolactobacillus inulinus]